MANSIMTKGFLPPRSVIIAHPGTQHSQQTALGLFKGGLLKKYLTGFYYRPTSLVGAMVAILPDFLRNRLYQQLLRRRRANLPARTVCSFPFFDLLAILCSRSHHLKTLNHLFTCLHNKFFIPFAIRQIARHPPRVFIGYEGSALPMFQECSKSGICTILDHTTGSVFKARKIYQQEKERFPELAANLGENHDEDYFRQHQIELDLADGILVGSEYARNNLIEHGITPQKIFCLPYGANLGIFKKPDKEQDEVEGPVTILYAGAISQHKGIMYLIKAMESFSSEECRLKIIGKWLLPDSFKKIIPSNIEIIPHLPQGELIRQYHEADIFVLPAIHEGSSIAVYEAMASGLAVITTPNAGSIITHMNDGMIIPSRDEKSIVASVRLLLQNMELRKELARNAVRTVQAFSWNNYHVKLKETVEKIFLNRVIARQ